MEFLPLDINIIKGNDLKDVNMMSKMDVYSVVSISGDSRNQSKQKTPIDKDGGSNPKWNHSMKFTLDGALAQQNKLTLDIKLISNRSFGDKEIGEVHVPIKELLDNSFNNISHSEKPEKTVTYGVRTPNGKTKGSVEISYKFREKYTAPAQAMAYPSAYPGSSAGYPPAGGYAPAGGYSLAGVCPQAGAPTGSYPYPPPGGYPPPQQGYGYPPPQQYGPPPQAGYGYGYSPAQKPKKSGMGAGAGVALGIGAGLLGGLLVGDMIADVGEVAAYDAGYDDGFGDGFDM